MCAKFATTLPRYCEMPDGDEIRAHHEAAHARRHIARDHRQAEAADQQLAQRIQARSPTP